MPKLKQAIIVLVALAILTVTPAFAASNCKDGKFVGSYTRANLFADVWGDGSGVDHTFLSQLTLSSDGSFHEEFTGAPELMMTGGTGTPLIGSWKCRSDGMLVVTTLTAVYAPTNDAALHGILNVPVDLLLVANIRHTRLFSVTDVNTLTRVQNRPRVYTPAEDPTDPAGGTLRSLNTTEVVYKRVVASDADLLAP